MTSKESDVSKLFSKFKLDNKELITVKLFADNRLKNSENIKQLSPFINLYIEIEYCSKDRINSFDKKMRNAADFIFIVSDNMSKDLINDINIYDIKNIFFIEDNTKIKEKIKNFISLSLSKKDILREKYYKKFKIPKESFELSEILNFQNLSKKISQELNIDMTKEDIINLVNNNDFSIEEKDSYIKNILNNIESVNSYIKLNYDENVKKVLVKSFNEKFINLIENVKASVFYDYIYYLFLPEFKYNLAKKTYASFCNVEEI